MMNRNMVQISQKSIDDERLKGARMVVLFRWAFIVLLALLLAVQYSSGYRAETMHALRLLAVYLVTNLFFTGAVIRRYDAPWVGYFGAVTDIGIVLFHINHLSLYFDPMAVSAAATIFLIPFMILLYTFRLDRKLLIFIIVLGIGGLGLLYGYHYRLQPGTYQVSLSLTPVAQAFKLTYILFIGLLCIYHQHSIYRFIGRQLDHLRKESDLQMQISLEREKSRHAEELKAINANLEAKVQQRTTELTEANTQLVKLQKENLQSQFEVLKQQVNPHFLFNSLNVLTSLIRVDPTTAEKFTVQLSKVYRYVLENKEKDLVTLATEMDFLKAYIYLLEIRFADKVTIKSSIAERDAELLVVPLALQLLIENAIKHNTFSRKRPLTIELFIDGERMLHVVNNLQNRETQMLSTGVGLANISKRYALLAERQPVFEISGDRFVAKIPLMVKGKTGSEQSGDERPEVE
jgi:sensor histidine kinase YesM